MTSIPLTQRLRISAGRYIPFLKQTPSLEDRKRLMLLRPVHNSLITVEERDDGEIILHIPVKEKVGFFTKILAKCVQMPSEKRVELDEVGSFVWKLCDGSNTLESVVQKVGREYRMNRREAEVSTTTFMEMLIQRNFIAFYKKTRKGG